MSGSISSYHDAKIGSGAALYSSGPAVIQMPLFQATGQAAVTDTATLNAAINAAAAVTAGNVTITLANSITETATLDAINLQPGVSLTIDGRGNALDGAGAFRGLFAYSGTITVQNLAINNTVAEGGKGGGEGAGGGAGLGGGLFVAGTNAGLASGAAVTLDNVTFSYNKAIGGAGGGGGGEFEGNLGPYGTFGGGGGLGGDGGNYSLNGGGGGGIGGAGGTASAGVAGIVPGAPSGGGGSPAVAERPGETFPGGIDGGGGGSSSFGSFRAGGGGGVGGAPGVPVASGSTGGAGGFGGGGGGSNGSGGDGGFGGGGGSTRGNGGFGGGGASRSQSGGFGAGAGSLETDNNGIFSLYNGGGGLGAGGAVFVQEGGKLTINGGRMSDGSAVGGAGGTGFMEGAAPAIRNGQGLGSGIFLQGNQTLVLSQPTPGMQPTLISDVIADQSGSGGTGGNAGAGKLSIAGPGTVTLAAQNTYAGGTLISGGTLDLAAAGAGGTGPIGFTGDTLATLQLSSAALPSGGTFLNTISGFDGAKLLDIRGLGYERDATATILGNTLTVSSRGSTVRLTLSDVDYATPVQLTTSAGLRGNVVVSAVPAVGKDTIALQISEDAFDGDAQYTIAIDGTTLGGVRTATASHSAGATENVTIKGDWGPGAHKIGISFINDAYGGTAETDRNLYVDSLTYDGRPSIPATAALYSAGTQEFTIPSAAAATKLTLLLAGDAYLGDAQYSVAVDGRPVGAVGTVTASNAGGQTQAVDIPTTLAAGTHDLALSFLNDAYGGTPATDRNLYLRGLEVNGAPVPGIFASLFSSGTENFSFVVPQS